MPATSERPWLSSYAEGVPAEIDVTGETLCDLLDTAVARFGPKVALDFYGATMTFTQLGEQVARVAGALRALGISAGDRVALILPNCPQHVVAFYAVLRLGGIVVETNPLYTADELAYQLADSGARLAIAWDVVVPTIEGIRSQTALTEIVDDDLIGLLKEQSADEGNVGLESAIGSKWINNGQAVATA